MSKKRKRKPATNFRAAMRIEDVPVHVPPPWRAALPQTPDHRLLMEMGVPGIPVTPGPVFAEPGPPPEFFSEDWWNEHKADTKIVIAFEHDPGLDEVELLVAFEKFCALHMAYSRRPFATADPIDYPLYHIKPLWAVKVK